MPAPTVFTKISELDELAVAPATDDELPINDTSATETKRISIANLLLGSTLQAAYNAGVAIAVLAAKGAVALSNAADATDLIQLARTFAGGGDALDITMGSGTTGRALDITLAAGATGRAIRATVPTGIDVFFGTDGTNQIQVRPVLLEMLGASARIKVPVGAAANPSLAVGSDTEGLSNDSSDLIASAQGIEVARLAAVSGTDPQARFRAGTLATPSVALGVVDTGAYAPDDDTVAVVASGVEVERWTAPAGANPQALAANGTPAKPSRAYASDDDTGDYRVGANQYGIATGGTLRATIDSAGLLLAAGVLSTPAGSVGTPAINVSQSDTGLYDGGADVLSVAAGGVNVARFQAPGGLSPQFLVPTGATPGIAGIGDTDTGLSWPSADILAVKTGNTVILQFGTATGISMGVGTPAAPALNSIFDLDTGPFFAGGDVFGIASGGKTAWSVKRASDVPETAAITVESDYVRTTDATATTLWSKTLTAARVYRVTARIVARNEAATGRAYYVREALVYREGAGAVLEGAVAATVTVESDAAWDATIDVDTNDVRVRITGVAATNISWAATVEVQAISTSA